VATIHEGRFGGRSALGTFTLVQILVDEVSGYDGEVYLFDRHCHACNVERPVAAGSRWLEVHGVLGSAANLKRIPVDGEALNTNFFR
jgi:hypothetical protein